MKIYRAENKNHNRKVIVATDEHSAVGIVLDMGFVKKPENCTLEDITHEYTNHHGGFVMPDRQGQLVMAIDENGNPTWSTCCAN